MKDLNIESLSPKIKETDAWKEAESVYSFHAAENMMPVQYRLGPAPTNKQFIEILQGIIKVCPAYYPAYLDLGIRMLTTSIEKATGHMDTGFEICIRVSDWETIDKDYEIVFENLEKKCHPEFVVRYALKLIERFPQKALLYDSAAYAYSSLNCYKEAIAFGVKAITLAPANSYFLNNLGMSYLAERNFDEAEKCFGLSIKADPTHRHPVYNLIDCKIMKAKGLSLNEYYLLPAEVEKYYSGADGDMDGLDEYARKMNFLKLYVCKGVMQEKQQFKVHDLASDFTTLTLFLAFVESISEDAFLWEDIDHVTLNFKRILHLFILKHKDADDALLDEIYKSLWMFYGFLSENNTISKQKFEKFREIATEIKSNVFDKMHLYNKIRHNPKLNGTMKEKAIDELFDGDNLGMSIW